MDEINYQRLGLTRIEGEVYLSLIKLGTTKAGPIIKKLGFHRATVYDALERLIEKGLVTYVFREKTKLFQTTPPEHLLDMIENEKKELISKERYTKNMIKELEKIRGVSKRTESAQIYQGKTGLRSVFEDILKYEVICSIASKSRFGNALGSYFEQFQRKKKAKGIKDRILIDESLKGTGYVKKIYGEVRFLPKDYEYPTATMIYGDKVAILVFSDYPLAFVIENKEVSDSYRAYFELLWKKAIK